MTRHTEMLVRDARFAGRSLLKRPGFTAVAVVTLALGIGANTAMFSVIRGVLLRPLPFNDADGLITIDVASAERPGPMSYPDLSDLAEQSDAIQSLVGSGPANWILTGWGEPAMVEVARLTEGLLSTFHEAPALGRDLRADEFGADGAVVVVVSHQFWQQRMGADPEVVGRTVHLNSIPYEIVGVAPAGFQYPAGVEFWVPRLLNLEGCGRGCHTFRTVGRLAAGATLERAILEVEAIARNLEAAYPGTNSGKRFLVRSLKSSVVDDVEQGLWILLAAVALVLLTACANVVNLLLARAPAREGELAVRAALGASRSRLASQMVVESGVLATLGGGLGLALAFLGIELFRRTAAGTIPRIEQIGIDTVVLGVTLLTVVLVTLGFGLAPAVTASRTSFHGAISQSGRGGSAARPAMQLRRVLLAGEVAVSVTLLIGAGLLLRTFVHLLSVDVGFEPARILRFSVDLPDERYPDPATGSRFYSALEESIGALPGVESVGSMWSPPFGWGHATGDILIEGRPEPVQGEGREAAVHAITPQLLSTLGIRLMSGRPLLAADNRAGAEPVALVNQEFVRQHFPNEDPIGRRFRSTVDLDYGSPTWRIVGVVGDVHFRALTSDPGVDVFLPQALYGPNSMVVHVRTGVPSASVLPQIREFVGELDANVPIYRVETADQAIAEHVAPTRLYLLLVGLFAGTAVSLAAIGLYGVVTFLVTQRTREIGIRVALGARRRRIMRLVVGQGMWPAAVGLVVGAGVAAAAGRVLRSVLFGVHAYDPVIFAGAIGVIAAVAFAAAAIPALRASRLDPAGILRTE